MQLTFDSIEEVMEFVAKISPANAKAPAQKAPAQKAPAQKAPAKTEVPAKTEAPKAEQTPASVPTYKGKTVDGVPALIAAIQAIPATREMVEHILDRTGMTGQRVSNMPENLIGKAVEALKEIAPE